MSEKEIKRRKIASRVFAEAWELKRRTIAFTYSIGVAIRICWKTVRSMARFVYSKVRGTSFGNRQLLLRRLSLYDSRDIFLQLVREPYNPIDPYAIQIWAVVRSKGGGCIGYVSKEIASELAVLMDSGRSVVVLFDGITGGGSKYYGCNYRLLPI
ncbi:HIRAN domain-containing protein [Ruminiclostridium cellobioparum]|uniref:HIRAN domain-containing protein n=1 Tax=Ruminiclostridium cellobioparum TaxID=29355 RepID=UPI0028B072BC|nr:HIRAN domain-containing protein [Ruminiclostridium cellobioparum]